MTDVVTRLRSLAAAAGAALLERMDTLAFGWLRARQRAGYGGGMEALRRRYDQEELEQYFQQRAVLFLADTAAGMLERERTPQVELEIVPGPAYGGRPIRALLQWEAPQDFDRVRGEDSPVELRLLDPQPCGHPLRYQIPTVQGPLCAVCELRDTGNLPELENDLIHQ